MGYRILFTTALVFMVSICYHAGTLMADEQLPPADPPVVKHFCYVYKETVPAEECGQCTNSSCSACDEINGICSGGSRACSPGKTVYEKKQQDGNQQLTVVTYVCFCDFDCVPEGGHENCGPGIGCVPDMDNPECSIVSYPTEIGQGSCSTIPA